MASTVEAATITVNASNSQTLVSVVTFTGGMRLKVRTPDSNVYFGNAATSGASSGFLLAPNVDYEFIVKPVILGGGSDNNDIKVYNTGGSSATVTYAATAL